MTPAEVSGTFKRDAGVLPHVFEFVGSFFSSGDIDTKYRFPVELAVEEVFMNLVRHNPGGRGEIAIRLGLHDNELVVAVTDFDTARFDINTDVPAVDVNEPLETRATGGLGVHLVKKMMDRVDYSHSDGVGTITLYKNLE